MAVKLSNNATSTLAVNINETATGLTIQSADAGLFPHLLTGDWFPLTIYDATKYEIVHVTKRVGGVFTIKRAQEGTNAHAWNVGTRADLRLTKAVVQELQQKLMDDFNTLNGMIDAVDIKGDNSYLPKAGGTITGALTIDDKLKVKGDVEIEGNTTADTLDVQTITATTGTIATLNSTHITTTDTIKAGTAGFGTDGNIKGEKWQEWEEEFAFEAISKRIDARANAIATEKINATCVTNVRLAGWAAISGPKNTSQNLPNGYLVSYAHWANDWRVDLIAGKQLQIYIPDIGWRAAASE